MQSPRQDKHRGISYLELLLNFVATECVLPPKLQGRPGRGIYLDLLQGPGRLCPFALKEVMLTFVAALKTLTRVTGVQLLRSKAHHRIRSLSMYPGEGLGRKGILDRAQMQELQRTSELLEGYMAAKALEGLRSFCLQQAPPTAVGATVTARWQQAETGRQAAPFARTMNLPARLSLAVALLCIAGTRALSTSVQSIIQHETI